MTLKTKTVLKRLARAAAAGAVAYVAGKITGPDVLDLVPDPYDLVVTGTVAPLLLALEKFLRYGSDVGEF